MITTSKGFSVTSLSVLKQLYIRAPASQALPNSLHQRVVTHCDTLYRVVCCDDGVRLLLRHLQNTGIAVAISDCETKSNSCHDMEITVGSKLCCLERYLRTETCKKSR